MRLTIFTRVMLSVVLTTLCGAGCDQDADVPPPRGPSGDPVASPHRPAPAKSGTEATSGIEIDDYVAWLVAGDPRRLEFLAAEARRLESTPVPYEKEPPPPLVADALAETSVKVDRFELSRKDGEPVTRVVVQWPQELRSAQVDAEPEIAWSIEVFEESGSGLALITRHLFTEFARRGPYPPGPIEFQTAGDRYLFAILDRPSSSMGTGMSGRSRAWFQISDAGVSQVFAENGLSEDVNTSLYVASGTVNSRVAELDGRPAIFADTWKALKPAEGNAEKFFYRGVTVWRQEQDHEGFEIDPRFSSLSEDQAARAFSTPRTDDLFRDKMPESVRDAAEFMGLSDD